MSIELYPRFFLLPALLAGANGKLFEAGQDRAETIAVQEAYLRDVSRQMFVMGKGKKLQLGFSFDFPAHCAFML